MAAEVNNVIRVIPGSCVTLGASPPFLKGDDSWAGFVGQLRTWVSNWVWSWGVQGTGLRMGPSVCVGVPRVPVLWRNQSEVWAEIYHATDGMTKWRKFYVNCDRSSWPHRSLILSLGLQQKIGHGQGFVLKYSLLVFIVMRHNVMMAQPVFKVCVFATSHHCEEYKWNRVRRGIWETGLLGHTCGLLVTRQTHF